MMRTRFLRSLAAATLVAGSPFLSAAPPEAAPDQPTAEPTPAPATTPEESFIDARQSAVGEKIGSLTVLGKTYEEVVITRVDDVGIQIRHAAGSKRIPYQELPKAMRDRFGYSFAKARETAKAEKAKATEHAKEHAGQIKELAEKRAEMRAQALRVQTAEEAKRSIEDLRGKITKLRYGIISTQTEISTHEAKAYRYDLDSHYTVTKADRDGNISYEVRIKHGQVRMANHHRTEAVKLRSKIKEAEVLIDNYGEDIQDLERELKDR